MAQLASTTQLPKHPAPTSANPNGAANAFPFIPRKEFIPQQRVISSFALLALSSANLVRLYSFPPAVIAALRRVLDHHDLIVNVREDADKHFFEFCLDRRPWASPKSVETEELLVSILAAILQCGYAFLSTLDYGREPDDRLAIAFSKPVSVVPTGIPVSSSVVTLPQPAFAPFAISFTSQSILRVVNPPLHSTPAILQAVRGSWPRGVVSEKKFGEFTWQFRLKGYKFFQQDTFATDSLQQILTLLTTLDSHAFTLLTSLTMGSRSRKQDLWIFTGPSEDVPVASAESPHSSPGHSTHELRGEIPGYASQASNEKLAPVASSFRVGNAIPSTSSPLKPAFLPTYKAPGNMLRKSSPKVHIPLAYMADIDSATNSPVENKQHPFSSSMGSVDMTGVGSGRGKGGERLSRSPDVLFMTAGIPGYAQMYGYREGIINPWQSTGQMLVTPPTVGLHGQGVEADTATHGSAQSQDATLPNPHSRDASSEGAVPPSAADLASLPAYAFIPNTFMQPDTPSPSSVPATGDGNTTEEHPPERIQDVPAHNGNTQSRISAPDMPRTPTPPLLGSGIFRDSAFSFTTGRASFEIPITWTGRDPEPTRATLARIKEEEIGRERERLQEQSAPQVPLLSGPLAPGAWALTPRDERRYDDVATNMFPPTIHEQPSQEHDDLPRPATKGNIGSNGKAADARPVLSRLNSAAVLKDRTKDRVASSTHSSEKTQTSTPSNIVGGTRRRPSPSRRDSDASGWVLVNVERGERPNQDGKGKPRHTQSVSPDPSRRTRSPTVSGAANSPVSQRPFPHMRSSSDTHVPRSQRDHAKEAGPGMSTMHPAAKAIVIIDAVGAKDKGHEKSASGSGFKHIFSRSRDKGQSSQSTTPPAKSPDPSRRAPRTTGNGNGVSAKNPDKEASRTVPRARTGHASSR